MTEAVRKAPCFRLNSRLRHRAVGNEGVLVQLERGQVLVVNEVGLFVVQQLGSRPMTIAGLAAAVMAEFSVELSEARMDVEAFVGRLREEDAVEEVDVAGIGESGA